METKIEIVSLTILLIALVLSAYILHQNKLAPEDPSLIEFHREALSQCIYELDKTEKALNTCDTQFQEIYTQSEELLRLLVACFNQTQRTMEYCEQE